MFKLFLNSIKFYFGKIWENVLNFCATLFYKFLKIFKSLWWVHFCWMFLQNRYFGDAIAVQNVRGIHLWNFVWCSPLEPKFWLRLCLAPQILESRKPHDLNPRPPAFATSALTTRQQWIVIEFKSNRGFYITTYSGQYDARVPKNPFGSKISHTYWSYF